MARTIRAIAGLFSMLAGIVLALGVPFSLHMRKEPITFDWHFIALVLVLLGLGYLLIGGNAQHLVDVVQTIKGNLKEQHRRRRQR